MKLLTTLSLADNISAILLFCYGVQTYIIRFEGERERETIVRARKASVRTKYN